MTDSNKPGEQGKAPRTLTDAQSGIDPQGQKPLVEPAPAQKPLPTEPPKKGDLLKG